METKEFIALPQYKEQYEQKRELVEAGVREITTEFRTEAVEYGLDARAAAESVLSVIERGGKRGRGVLLETGVRLYNESTDKPVSDAVIRRAAGIIEVIHGCLLVKDDVTDESALRRGDSTAHTQMGHYFGDRGAKVEPHRLGEQTVLMVADTMLFKAQTQLLALDVPDRRIRRASMALNDGLRITGWGQTLDTMSVAQQDMTLEEAKTIATIKTALYSQLLPMQVGVSLAGALPEDLDLFTKYAIEAGFAFQMQDDILGVFGSEQETGKPRTDDVIQGKNTVLHLMALQRATPEQRRMLEGAHGNRDLTAVEFEAYQTVLQDTGARDEVSMWAGVSARRAAVAIEEAAERSTGKGWPFEQVQFMKNMAMATVNRTS